MSLDVDTLPPHEVAAHMQATIEDARAVHGQLRDLIAAGQQPAQLMTHVLTATEPVKVDKQSTEAETFALGILNPNPIPIYLGLNGGSATSEARAVSCPPAALLVLPVAVAQLEVGAEPADVATNDAVVHVLRFRTCQPAFLGAI